MGSSTENSAFFTTLNPWDTTRIPGGSSGGCAASVAAHECFASVGSDTGGSIRQPAALCGVVGMKPTFGNVSLEGVVPLSWSMDHVGVMAPSAVASVVGAGFGSMGVPGVNQRRPRIKPPAMFRVQCSVRAL